MINRAFVAEHRQQTEARTRAEATAPQTKKNHTAERRLQNTNKTTKLTKQNAGRVQAAGGGGRAGRPNTGLGVVDQAQTTQRR